MRDALNSRPGRTRQFILGDRIGRRVAGIHPARRKRRTEGGEGTGRQAQIGVVAVVVAAGTGVLAVGIAIGIQGAVPEPASWAMMIIGFGAVGSALRQGKGKEARETAAA